MATVCARQGCKRRTRPRATYCSPACQKAASRARGRSEAGGQVVDLPGQAPPSVVSATRATLAEFGRLDHYLGQAAMAAAERLDAARAIHGYAGLLDSYRDTMRDALKDVDERNDDTAEDIRAAALSLIRGA